MNPEDFPPEKAEDSRLVAYRGVVERARRLALARLRQAGRAKVPNRCPVNARDVLIAAAIKQLDWSWKPGEFGPCSHGGEYRVPPSPEEYFEDVAEAQLVALAEAGYLVVPVFDTDEGRAAAQVDPGGKHDAWLEARGGPHG